MRDKAMIVDGEEVAENAESDGRDGWIRICDVDIPPPPLAACTFDTTEPRLVIARIENINFKSYAGTRELGPFNKNFTAIVGPNGSGKSNVIDAMLFVFGYRAQKIRSKKVGVLIHSSDNFPDIQSCTVRVHFQKVKDLEDGNYEVIPGSQFSIGRTAYRDNSSTYEINGKRVQFKKVSELLRSYGIDLDHNRFLILQGEIEMIAMMKPKGTEHDTGMLEYLEDIIGCNRLIEPTEIFKKRVDDLNEARTERLNRVKVVQKEMDDLLGAKNEAVQYIKLENKLATIKNIFYQVQLLERKMEVQRCIESLDESNRLLGTLKNDQKLLDDECHKLEEGCSTLQAAYETKDAVKDADSAKFFELDRKDVALRENIVLAKNKRKTIKTNVDAEEKKLKDLQKQPEKFEGEAAELETKKASLERKKEAEEQKLKEVIVSTKEETEGLQEEKGKLEAQLIGLKKVVNEKKSAMDLAQSQLDMYVNNERKETARLKELEEKYEHITTSVADIRNLIEDAESKIPTTEYNLKHLQKTREQLSGKEKMASEEIRVKRARVEEMRATINSSRSRGAIIDSLMEQQRLGNISGIFGRLGDLGGIDEKYDIAISTACGALDNIVTDTITTAQKCVQYLKLHSKGYCTFIALDKMQRWIPESKQKNVAQSPYPERVPRLFDLVKVKDERVLPALYFALRDTLVADNLEQATRIGMHGSTRYRVVTLKGELIDLAGTMTGGGGRPRKGRMGKSVASADVSLKDLENFEASLQKQIKEAEAFREERMKLDGLISQSEKELASHHHILAKNKSECLAVQDRQAQLSQQLIEQKPRVLAAAPDQNKVRELQSELNSNTKSYNKANSAAQEIEAKVKSLHSEITAITKGKYGAVQKVIDKLVKDISTVRTNINKCTTAAKTALRNQRKSEAKLQDLNQEFTELEIKMKSMTEEMAATEEIGRTYANNIKKAEAELKEMDAKKKTLQKEINAVKEKELQLKKNKIELQQELKAKEGELKGKEYRVKEMKSLLAELKIHVIEGEEETPMTLPTFIDTELSSQSSNALKLEITNMDSQMKAMKPNISVIAEYRRKEQLYRKKIEELEDTTRERDKMKSHHDELRQKRLDEFLAGFGKITAKLKEVYQMITLGGDAELELVDTLDPFTEGIVFSVRPPKKSWKNITNLSGGEKTLSSLALVFALHYYKPTPFYVMDEIDAALDFKNVSIVGNYIRERTKNAQFIIISLRNNMFELSDRLVGIFKTFNCTNAVTIEPRELADRKHVDKDTPKGQVMTFLTNSMLCVGES